MDILVEKNGRYEPKPIVLDRRTEGQKELPITRMPVRYLLPLSDS